MTDVNDVVNPLTRLSLRHKYGIKCNITSGHVQCEISDETETDDNGPYQHQQVRRLVMILTDFGLSLNI